MRVDLRFIAEMIQPGTRVLDIGSGDGSLIEHLFRENGCDARGIEIDMAQVTHAVAHGLPVMHGDADHDLSQYPDGAFDAAGRGTPARGAAPDAAHRHPRAGELSEFRPLAGALAPGVLGAHANDAHLGAAVVRNAEYSPLHRAGFLRTLRAGRLPRGAMAGNRRGGAEIALAAIFMAGEYVWRAGFVSSAEGVRKKETVLF